MIEPDDAVDRVCPAHDRLASAPEPFIGRFADGERHALDRRTDEERERTVRAYAAYVEFLGMAGVPVDARYAHDESYLGPDHNDDDREERVSHETLFADSVSRAGGFLELGGMLTDDAVSLCRSRLEVIASTVATDLGRRFNGEVPEGYELVARVEVRRA